MIGDDDKDFYNDIKDKFKNNIEIIGSALINLEKLDIPEIKDDFNNIQSYFISKNNNDLKDLINDSLKFITLSIEDPENLQSLTYD